MTSEYLIGALALGAAAWAFVVSYQRFAFERQLRRLAEHGQRTNATVVSVTPEASSHTIVLRYRFRDPRNRLHIFGSATLPASEALMQPGTELRAVFLPEDPTINAPVEVIEQVAHVKDEPAAEHVVATHTRE